MKYVVEINRYDDYRCRSNEKMKIQTQIYFLSPKTPTFSHQILLKNLKSVTKLQQMIHIGSQLGSDAILLVPISFESCNLVKILI